MATQRQKVTDPLSQQRDQRFRGAQVNPTTVNRTDFIGEPVSDAGAMVESLLNFAGVTGEAYAAKLDKQVEADKIIQTQRAHAGLPPDLNSTEGGYKAHMAVAIKNQQLKAQAKLNELSKGKYTDEEWEDIVRDTYAEMDTALSTEYADYDGQKEMQKLASLSMAEIMPQVVSQREASKLDQEIQSRMQDEEDILINELKLTGDAAALVQRFETRTSAMKLTQSQKEAILSKVVLNSDNQTAVEMTKLFKGDRDSSLYERTGQIQAHGDQLTSDAYANNAGELGLEFSNFQSDFLSGKYTPDEAVRYIDKRNRETDNKFMTKGQAAAMFSKAKEAIAGRNRMMELVQGIQQGERSLIPGADKEEMQAALAAGYNQELQAGIRNIQKNIPAEQQGAEINALIQRSSQKWADHSARFGYTIKEWETGFASMANANLAAVTTPSGEIESLPEQHAEALQRMEQMSPQAQEFYLSKLGSREADILKNTLALRDMGMTGPQALGTAQRMSRNPVPTSAKDIEDAYEEISSAFMENGWSQDVPDFAQGYYAMEIRRKLAAHPMPASESARKQILAHFEKNWTTTDDGLKLRGSPQRLSQLTGIHATSIGRAVQGLMEQKRAELEPYLETYGIEYDEVIPDVDPEGGMIRFVGPNGETLSTTAYPLSSLKGSFLHYKESMETRAQRMRDQYERTNTMPGLLNRTYED